MNIFKRKKAKVKTPPQHQSSGRVTELLDMSTEKIDISDNFDSQSRNGYEVNPFIYRSINFIADACSSVPPVLFNKNNEEIENHPILDLLKHPNPITTKSKLISDIVLYLMLNGNAYIKKVIGGGVPRELYVLNPRDVSIVEGYSMVQPIKEYIHSTRQGVEWIQPEEMIHIRLTNPRSDIYGLSPLSAAAESAQQNRDGRVWNTKLVQNGARTTGIIKNIHRLNDAEYQTFKERFTESYSRSGSTGRPMLLEEGLEWVPMGMSQVEMDFILSQTLSSREIAIALGVPPEKIGDSANKTYSNAQEANKSFATDTQIPMLTKIYDALTLGLSLYWQDVDEIAFNKDSIEALNENNTELYTRVISAGNAGILTINEQRIELGFGDVGVDGDIIFRPFGLVPLEETTKPIPEIDWNNNMQGVSNEETVADSVEKQ